MNINISVKTKDCRESNIAGRSRNRVANEKQEIPQYICQKIPYCICQEEVVAYTKRSFRGQENTAKDKKKVVAEMVRIGQAWQEFENFESVRNTIKVAHSSSCVKNKSRNQYRSLC